MYVTFDQLVIKNSNGYCLHRILFKVDSTTLFINDVISTLSVAIDDSKMPLFCTNTLFNNYSLFVRSLKRY